MGRETRQNKNYISGLTVPYTPRAHLLLSAQALMLHVTQATPDGNGDDMISTQSSRELLK